MVMSPATITASLLGSQWWPSPVPRGFQNLVISWFVLKNFLHFSLIRNEPAGSGCCSIAERFVLLSLLLLFFCFTSVCYTVLFPAFWGRRRINGTSFLLMKIFKSVSAFYIPWILCSMFIIIVFQEFRIFTFYFWLKKVLVGNCEKFRRRPFPLVSWFCQPLVLLRY